MIPVLSRTFHRRRTVSVLAPVAGMALWLQDAIVGDPVSTWSDSSGEGNDATSSGALRPSLVANWTNGLPAVRGNGSLMQATCPSGNVTVQMVCSVVAFSGGYSRFFNGAIGQDSCVYEEPSSDAIGMYSGGFGPTNVAISAGTPYIISAVFPGKLVVNGVEHTASMNAFSGGTFGIFGRQDAAYFVNGIIGEMIAHVDLSDSDRQKNERYLAAKWGITLA